MALRQLQDTNPAKFSRQEVTRTPLGRLLAPADHGLHHQVVIPVFQRPYCWPERQLQPWLDNVLYGADEMCDPAKDDLVAEVNDLENIDSFHSVGIGRFKLTEVGLMCVDGQQRLTTTSLLIAAIADLLQELGSDVENVMEDCEHFLFRDKERLTEAVRSDDIPSALSCLRLLPSDTDRLPYLYCVLGNRTEAQITHNVPVDHAVLQTSQYFYFSIRALLNSQKHKVLFLRKLLRSSVLWMRMMVVTVESEVNLCQWFLWLQEKSLMGFAALLTNDTPGVSFRAGDLIKNLLLSVFLEKSVSFQDEVYNKFWSRRMQELMGTDYFIEKFLAQYDESVTKPGQIEELSDDRLAGLQLYGKFYGFYDTMTREKDTDLETAHEKIIKQLETFAETFVIKS